MSHTVYQIVNCQTRTEEQKLYNDDRNTLVSVSQTTSEKCVAADFWIDGITQLNECLRETASNSKQKLL